MFLWVSWQILLWWRLLAWCPCFVMVYSAAPLFVLQLQIRHKRAVCSVVVQVLTALCVTCCCCCRVQEGHRLWQEPAVVSVAHAAVHIARDGLVRLGSCLWVRLCSMGPTAELAATFSCSFGLPLFQQQQRCWTVCFPSLQPVCRTLLNVFAAQLHVCCVIDCFADVLSAGVLLPGVVSAPSAAG
jgi:hypothetical protein